MVRLVIFGWGWKTYVDSMSNYSYHFNSWNAVVESMYYRCCFFPMLKWLQWIHVVSTLWFQLCWGREGGVGRVEKLLLNQCIIDANFSMLKWLQWIDIVSTLWFQLCWGVWGRTGRVEKLLLNQCSIDAIFSMLKCLTENWHCFNLLVSILLGAGSVSRGGRGFIAYARQLNSTRLESVQS